MFITVRGKKDQSVLVNLENVTKIEVASSGKALITFNENEHFLETNETFNSVQSKIDKAGKIALEKD